MTCQNLWDATGEILREKVVALNACNRKQVRYKIKDLNVHQKSQEKKSKLYQNTQNIKI